MIYKTEFKELTNLNTYIGTGNPNSKILIVGKEVATNINSASPIEKQNTISTLNNASDWNRNITNNTTQEEIKNWEYDENLNINLVDNNPLFAFKGTIKKNTSDTWKKYQKLYDLIFSGNINKDNELELNFQKDFFLTEMSELPSKTTGNAIKNPEFEVKLQNRKDTFFKSKFIQNFPIVILACSNYIVNNQKNREIDNIFNVNFIEEKGTAKQKFWVHHSNSESPKLVIHTRQLSNAVEDELLIRIAKEINDYCCQQGINLIRA